jgi:CPA2 family monovalent cation:H+ antiporter-2
VDRKLPHRLQTTAALYGSWLERIRTAGPTRRMTPVRRMTRLLVLDVVLLAALIIAAALSMPMAEARFEHARPFVIAIAAVLASPLLLGIGGWLGGSGEPLPWPRCRGRARGWISTGRPGKC